MQLMPTLQIRKFIASLTIGVQFGRRKKRVNKGEYPVSQVTQFRGSECRSMIFIKPKFLIIVVEIIRLRNYLITREHFGFAGGGRRGIPHLRALILA